MILLALALVSGTAAASDPVFFLDARMR